MRKIPEYTEFFISLVKAFPLCPITEETYDQAKSLMLTMSSLIADKMIPLRKLPSVELYMHALDSFIVDYEEDVK